MMRGEAMPCAAMRGRLKPPVRQRATRGKVGLRTRFAREPPFVVAAYGNTSRRHTQVVWWRRLCTNAPASSPYAMLILAMS